MGGLSTFFPIMPWEIGSQQTSHWLPAFPSHFQNFARGMRTNLPRPDQRMLSPFSERRSVLVLHWSWKSNGIADRRSGGWDPRAATGSGGHWGLTTARSFEKRERKPSNTNLLSAGTKSMSPCSPPLFCKPCGSLPLSSIHISTDLTQRKTIRNARGGNFRGSIWDRLRGFWLRIWFREQNLVWFRRCVDLL